MKGTSLKMCHIFVTIWIFNLNNFPLPCSGLKILRWSVLRHCTHGGCRGPHNINRSWWLSHWINCRWRISIRARRLRRARYGSKLTLHWLLRSVLHLWWASHGNLCILHLCKDKTRMFCLDIDCRQPETHQGLKRVTRVQCS